MAAAGADGSAVADAEGGSCEAIDTRDPCDPRGLCLPASATVASRDADGSGGDESWGDAHAPPLSSHLKTEARHASRAGESPRATKSNTTAADWLDTCQSDDLSVSQNSMTAIQGG